MNSRPNSSPPKAAEVIVGADASAAYKAAAQRFVGRAKHAITERGVFSVALSGGSTPKKLFEMLASPAWREEVEWSRVAFFWGDERFVPPDDPKSNYRMAHEALLSKIPADPPKIFRFMTETGSAKNVAIKYESTIRDFFSEKTGVPKFDLMLLGLGTNGHTASLFPHRPILHEHQKLVVSDYVEEVQAERLSMTVPIINNAREIQFLVLGTDKAQILHDILEGPPQPEEWPAQLIAADGGGELIYIVDSDAARLLRKTKNISELSA